MMDASADLDNLAINSTADQRSCSHRSGAAHETKASFNSKDRTLRSNDDLPINASGVESLHKALSPSSMCGDSGNLHGASEEHENGEEPLVGEDELEEARRALESYAAFQVTLLRHIETEPTFNVSPQQVYLRQGREKPGSIGVVSPRHDPTSEDSLWDCGVGL
jgi:hypothetical protein